ncbi:MAG: NUDIX domain-containing protein [Paludibacter sp.]|nr:NUDIX domain-containing protein [Paludibacter sp.]
MRFDVLFRYCPVCGSKGFKPNNVKSMRCDECGFVMYVNPSAAVAAFIVNHRDELLICTRANDPEKGKFDLPGGFVDENEMAEQAIEREILEELGMKVDAGKYLFSIPNDYLYSGWMLPTLDLFFLFEVGENFVPIPADDVKECSFLPLDQIDVDKFGFKSMRQAVGRFLLNR